jgi:hypothetical protein
MQLFYFNYRSGEIQNHLNDPIIKGFAVVLGIWYNY